MLAVFSDEADYSVFRSEKGFLAKKIAVFMAIPYLEIFKNHMFGP